MPIRSFCLPLPIVQGQLDLYRECPSSLTRVDERRRGEIQVLHTLNLLPTFAGQLSGVCLSSVALNLSPCLFSPRISSRFTLALPTERTLKDQIDGD